MDCLNANWKILKRNLERLNELQQIRESTDAQSQGLDWLIWLVMGIIGLIWRRTIIGRFWIVLVLIWHLLIISLRIWMTIWRLIYSKIMEKLPTSVVHTFLLSKGSSFSYHWLPCIWRADSHCTQITASRNWFMKKDDAALQVSAWVDNIIIVVIIIMF